MGELIIWVLGIMVLSWLVLGGTIFAYPTARRLRAEKAVFGWIVKVPIYLFIFFGALSDVVFNATWGSIIFRELPHEWLFTDRLKRHWRGSDSKQKDRAAPWVRRVNLIDPGHVKLLKGKGILSK